MRPQIDLTLFKLEELLLQIRYLLFVLLWLTFLHLTQPQHLGADLHIFLTELLLVVLDEAD